MNSLGSLTGFEIDPIGIAEICGMRGATGFEGGNTPTLQPVKVGPQQKEERG